MIKQTEAQLKKACTEYLTMLRNRGELLFIRNNSGSFQVTRPDGSRGWMNNGEKGSPDFVVFFKDRTAGLELKSPTGKQSPEQKDWEQRLTKLNHDYHVIRSVDDLVRIISYYRSNSSVIKR